MYCCITLLSPKELPFWFLLCLLLICASLVLRGQDSFFVIVLADVDKANIAPVYLRSNVHLITESLSSTFQ